MLSPATLCSLLLLTVLWANMARAGSSFLSPEYQKAQRKRGLGSIENISFQQRKESKKLLTKPQPRAIEGWPHPEDERQAEGAEDELEIQFNAPLDVGIKLSEAQYQQHGRALGKFLQDILWEEAKEAQADQ